MRYLQPVRMADDAGSGPVWTRAKRHKGGGVPVVGLIIGALALLGAATAGLAIKERSFAGAGETLDKALASVIDFGRGLVGQAGAEAAREELTTTP